MTRHYGSRKSSRRGNGLPQQVLVMLVTFVLGYFTASIFDIEALSHWMTSQALTAGKNAQPVVANTAKEPQAAPRAKFEFYTLLENEPGVRASQVAAAARNATTQATNNSQLALRKAAEASAAISSPARPASPVTDIARMVPQAPATVNSAKTAPVVTATPKVAAPVRANHFVVQVASFKARHDAEQMKGALALKGFEVTVVPVMTPTQGSWFRVIIGPYPNRTLAQKAQAILARNERLNGMVRSAG
ncbi:MAG: cell division protein FtsN [Legionella sp.]|nr:MAG: cell division protein FtsN [Legionella sp.]PJD99573.1 MAG: cell division protein FtsN [Legionella sp.]